MAGALLGIGTSQKLALSVALGSVTYPAALFFLGGIPEDMRLHLSRNRRDQTGR
ncbi:MAG: hypothetical protein H0V76_10965 [Blastocatellia bacterium]|nr:hypothetical protein [Blastocatellia bacterium]